MTPDQALDVLDQMVARASGTRQDHVWAQQALAVLRQALNGDKPADDPG